MNLEEAMQRNNEVEPANQVTQDSCFNAPHGDSQQPSACRGAS